MLMFPQGGFLALTYRFLASRFSERELNTQLLVASRRHRCEDISNSNSIEAKMVSFQVLKPKNSLAGAR